MVKIFAKHGTSEKALVVCEREQVHKVQLMLVEKYGGNWVWVDKIQPHEHLKFDNGLVYRGYYSNNVRYANGIELS